MGAGAFLWQRRVGALTGRRVVVTRPRERAAALVAALEAEGAEVILFPAIEVVAPADSGPLRAAAGRIGEYEWVVFTSAYGVRALAEAGAEGHGRERPRAACVGEATAAEALEHGWADPLMPGRSTGRGLADALVAAGAVAGTAVLFPRAEDARRDLPDRLRAAGAHVDEVVAYAKRGAEAPGDELRGALESGRVDALTFTSPTTVTYLARRFGPMIRDVPVVVIGPTTEAAARKAGLRVCGVAREPTTRGLVAAVRATLNT